MWNSASGFKQHEAAGGIAGNDPTAKSAAGEGQKIPFVIVAAQRQFETVLTGSRAVTSARAATVFGENGLDMIAKAPVEWFVHRFNGDLDGGGFFAGFGGNGRGAIFDRDGFAFFDADDVCVAGDELEVVCDLADELVVEGFFEDELLAGFRAVKGDRGREDTESLSANSQGDESPQKDKESFQRPHNTMELHTSIRPAIVLK